MGVWRFWGPHGYLGGGSHQRLPALIRGNGPSFFSDVPSTLDVCVSADAGRPSSPPLVAIPWSVSRSRAEGMSGTAGRSATHSRPALTTS